MSVLAQTSAACNNHGWHHYVRLLQGALFCHVHHLAGEVMLVPTIATHSHRNVPTHCMSSLPLRCDIHVFATQDDASGFAMFDVSTSNVVCPHTSTQ